MADSDHPNNKEKKIQFTISLDDASPDAKAVVAAAPVKPPKPIFVDQVELFELANMALVEGKRNTEHGETLVRVVEFRDPDQRKKIIHLLSENFEEVVWDIIPMLFLLGADPRAAVRQRTAEIVGELMCEMDFIRIKDAVLVHWARVDNFWMNLCVGNALAVAARDPRYAKNILDLVRYWATSSNLSFNWTATICCFSLSSIWPEEILNFLEVALKKGSIDLLAIVTITLRSMSAKDPQLVLERLSEWISKRGDDMIPVRQAALIMFLDFVKLEHLLGENSPITRAAGIISVGLSDVKILDFKQIQKAMLDKLHFWTIKAGEKPETQAAIENLYMQLYVSAATARDKERILFYLQRWARSQTEKERTAFINILDHLTASGLITGG